MKLFKFQFPALVRGDEPHWSRAWFAADEAAFRADVASMFAHTVVLAVRECTAFERAEHAVSEHNDRHVSCIYGQSALQFLATTFGADSAEFHAYRVYLIQNEVQRDLCAAKRNLEAIA
jgi:hypothetical protein